MTAKFYNNDIDQKLLSASTSYLYEQAKELYDKSWLYRYYNDLSWVYGVTDEEIINFKVLYESTISEVLKRPELENMPLTNLKIKHTLDSFPKFDEKQFIYNNFEKMMLREVLAYIFFPYAFYLIFLNIKKTRLFRLLLSEILVKSKIISDTFNTDNIESWLEMEQRNKK